MPKLCNSRVTPLPPAAHVVGRLLRLPLHRSGAVGTLFAGEEKRQRSATRRKLPHSPLLFIYPMCRFCGHPDPGHSPGCPDYLNFAGRRFAARTRRPSKARARITVSPLCEVRLLGKDLNLQARTVHGLPDGSSPLWTGYAEASGVDGRRSCGASIPSPLGRTGPAGSLVLELACARRPARGAHFTLPGGNRGHLGTGERYRPRPTPTRGAT